VCLFNYELRTCVVSRLLRLWVYIVLWAAACGFRWQTLVVHSLVGHACGKTPDLGEAAEAAWGQVASVPVAKAAGAAWGCRTASHDNSMLAGQVNM
jgi:hypothetical protein